MYSFLDLKITWQIENSKSIKAWTLSLPFILALHLAVYILERSLEIMSYESEF